jgi:hypothetical protein
VDTGPNSPVLGVIQTLSPIIQQWAGNLLNSVSPSGSFAKGTPNRSGTDIDLFISLSPNTQPALKEIYESLFKKMAEVGYAPQRQNVSIKVRVGGNDVDLVPAKQQNAASQDHSLYRRRADTWTKTNVQTHIAYVRGAARSDEIRILKLWRDQKGLDFPSFYLELAAIAALTGRAHGAFADNVFAALIYLRDSFTGARFVDPANTNNIISDDLSANGKSLIQAAAARATKAKDWSEIVT